MPQRDQLGGRTDRAGHKAGPLRRRKRVRDLAGNLSRLPRELKGLIRNRILSQHQRGRAKAVGFDDIGPSGKVGSVDLGNHLGPRLTEDFVAAIFAGKVIEGQTGPLEHGAHRSIAHQHTLGECF